MLINLHTHHPAGNNTCLEIENLRPGQEKTTRFCSAGLHPWFLSEETLLSDCNWLREMAARPGVLAIGESGLDHIAKTPRDLQLRAFRESIAVSESTGKPLIIHCVRAHDEVLALKKELQPQQPWIFHGFNKHPKLAHMMVQAGCCLSFGKALFHPDSHAAAALAEIPADRFFLETDDATGLTIEEVYSRAALLRHETTASVIGLVQVNFERFFGKV